MIILLFVWLSILHFLFELIKVIELVVIMKLFYSQILLILLSFGLICLIFDLFTHLVLLVSIVKMCSFLLNPLFYQIDVKVTFHIRQFFPD
jgi:hypothetical protein